MHVLISVSLRGKTSRERLPDAAHFPASLFPGISPFVALMPWHWHGQRISPAPQRGGWQPQEGVTQREWCHPCAVPAWPLSGWGSPGAGHKQNTSCPSWSRASRRKTPKEPCEAAPHPAQTQAPCPGCWHCHQSRQGSLITGLSRSRVISTITHAVINCST